MAAIKTLIAFSTILVIAACTTSSGVLPIGDGVYTVTARAPISGSAGAKKAVFNDATSYCQGQGKSIKVIKSNEGFEKWHLDFYCK